MTETKADYKDLKYFKCRDIFIDIFKTKSGELK